MVYNENAWYLYKILKVLLTRIKKIELLHNEIKKKCRLTAFLEKGNAKQLSAPPKRNRDAENVTIVDIMNAAPSTVTVWVQYILAIVVLNNIDKITLTIYLFKMLETFLLFECNDSGDWE